jgi:hypothetical protein
MPQPLMLHERADPIHVRFFGGEREVAQPNGSAHLVEKLGWAWMLLCT